MRNFYTALDFEDNLILIGVNQGSSKRAKAYIDGSLDPPSKNGMTIVIVSLVLLVIFAVAVAFYIKQSQKANKPARVGSQSEDLPEGE